MGKFHGRSTQVHQLCVRDFAMIVSKVGRVTKSEESLLCSATERHRWSWRKQSGCHEGEDYNSWSGTLRGIKERRIFSRYLAIGIVHVVQWLGLWAPKAGSRDLIPCQRNRSHLAPLRPGATKKKKKRYLALKRRRKGDNHGVEESTSLYTSILLMGKS